jgi:hypothetical protein
MFWSRSALFSELDSLRDLIRTLRTDEGRGALEKGGVSTAVHVAAPKQHTIVTADANADVANAADATEPVRILWTVSVSVSVSVSISVSVSDEPENKAIRIRIRYR